MNPHPAVVDREDQKRALPCRAYMEGRCFAGSNCRFYHPDLSEPVMRVPDMPANFVPRAQQLTPWPYRRSRSNYGLPSNGYFPEPPSAVQEQPLFRVLPGGHDGIPPENQEYPGYGFGCMDDHQVPEFGDDQVSMGVTDDDYGLFYGNQGQSPETPPSPTVSEVTDFSAEFNYAHAYERNRRMQLLFDAAFPPLQAEPDLQNTVFKHISWKNFMVSGTAAPPPVHVPLMNTPSIPMGDQGFTWRDIFRRAGSTDISSISSSPSVLNLEATSSRVIQERHQDMLANGHPMSAKEELQRKIRQIASGLSAEQGSVSAPSFDTFFRACPFESNESLPPLVQPDVAPARDGMNEYLAQASANNAIKGGDNNEVEEEQELATDGEEATVFSVVMDPTVAALDLSSDSGINLSDSLENYNLIGENGATPDIKEKKNNELESERESF